MAWRVVFCFGLWLWTTGLAGALAEPVQYLTTATPTLDLRSGPGLEYDVVARLPQGTRVTLQERWGDWVRIEPLAGTPGGWALEHDLTPAPTDDPTAQTDLSPEMEQRRFDRLQRKGILIVRRLGDRLRLAIDPLHWRHLTPVQQVNFLRRAQRLYQTAEVEMRDRHSEALLARLTASGDVEFGESNAAPPAVPPLFSGGTAR